MPIEFLYQIVDLLLATLLLRMLFGLLQTNAGLLRFLLTIAVLAFATWWAYTLQGDQFEVARVFVLVLVIPATLLVLANVMPELRRAYQGARLSQLFGGGREIESEVLPELSRTVLEMAKQRMGAILVFPGSVAIDEMTQGGEEIDSGINRSLLLSIFNTTSPRHDGAAVIHNGRLRKVGAVLPLASADGVRTEWGTRHLAALGLSQQSDAQILVISEERGTISLASNGELKAVTPPSEQRVHDVLEDAMGRIRDERKRRRRRLWNWTLWFAAMVTAMSTSQLIEQFRMERRAAPLVTKSFPAGVVFTNIDRLPPELYLAAREVTSVEAIFNVPSTNPNFPGLQASPDFSIVVDLMGLSAGVSTVALTPEMLNNIPDGWQLESFDPDRIEVNLATATQFDIPVEVVTSGLSEEFLIKSSAPDPPSITATVRNTAWTEETTLKTQPIDLSGVIVWGQLTRKTEVVLPESVQVDGGAKTVPISVTFEIVKNPDYRPPPEAKPETATP
ncbi:MAG: diadenylate cyclase [Verrucomicrobiota bacterium]